MKKLLPLIFIFVNGCSTSSGMDPIVSYSGFDNAKVVEISPHGNACKELVCTGLGAQWSSDRPNFAILNVNVFNEYAGITGAELNIDGQKVKLEPARGITDTYNQSKVRISTKAFVVDIQIIDKILSSQKTWLRVHTPTGYLEDAVIDNKTDSKAYHALSRFITEVKS